MDALGQNVHLPNLDTLETLEKWVVVAYGGNKRPVTVQTIPQLRWYMFSKFQSDVNKLPPTTAALKYKIFRCHYVALVLRRSLQTIQDLPSQLNFGWESSGNAYTPIMTDELPAPLALIELSVCSCTTKCSTNRCKCKKNNLQCTDMCKCVDCENDNMSDGSDKEIEYESEDENDSV